MKSKGETMYIITRNKALPKVLKNSTFKTYDEARKAVRAWLYAQFKKGMVRSWRDWANNTATIGRYGFSIRRAS
jgi:hypothetical protein